MCLGKGRGQSHVIWLFVYAFIAYWNPIRAREMAHWLRATAALAVDPGSVLSTNMAAHNLCNSSLRDLMPSSGHHKYCIHTCIGIKMRESFIFKEADSQIMHGIVEFSYHPFFIGNLVYQNPMKYNSWGLSFSYLLLLALQETCPSGFWFLYIFWVRAFSFSEIFAPSLFPVPSLSFISANGIIYGMISLTSIF